jgi:hypothetical protein
MGIGLMLTLGIVTALSVALSPTALQQPTMLLIISVCGGLVGTMSNVLYYPHAATINASSSSASTGTTPTTPNPAESDGLADDESPSPQYSPAVRQTTAMASGMATASLFLAVLAILQQKQAHSNNYFSVQAYFGVVVAVFGVAIVGFVGTLMADQSLSATISNHMNGTTTSATTTATTTALKEELDNNDNGHLSNYVNTNNYGSMEISNHHYLRRRQSTNVSTNVNTTQNDMVDDVQDIDMTQPPTTVSAFFEIQEEEIPPLEEEEEHNHIHNDNNYPTMTSNIQSFSFWTLFWTMSQRHAKCNAGQFWLNLGTFFLPGIVPYSIRNFDNSQQALHYLTVTQLIGQTLGTIISGWKQSRSVWVQLTVFGILWIPTVILSLINNTTFQTSSQLHSAVPITLNALLNFGYGYSSTIFFHLVHADEAAAAAAAVVNGTLITTTAPPPASNNDDTMIHHPPLHCHHDPHIASRVLGSWKQLGAMLGSLIAYLLVVNGVIS